MSFESKQVVELNDEDLMGVSAGYGPVAVVAGIYAIAAVTAGGLVGADRAGAFD